MSTKDLQRLIRETEGEEARFAELMTDFCRLYSSTFRERMPVYPLVQVVHLSGHRYLRWRWVDEEGRHRAVNFFKTEDRVLLADLPLITRAAVLQFWMDSLELNGDFAAARTRRTKLMQCLTQLQSARRVMEEMVPRETLRQALQAVKVGVLH